MPKGTGFISCTNCGGTGAVNTTEIYMENGKPKSRTVRKICTTCNGRGGQHI